MAACIAASTCALTSGDALSWLSLDSESLVMTESPSSTCGFARLRSQSSCASSWRSTDRTSEVFDNDAAIDKSKISLATSFAWRLIHHVNEDQHEIVDHHLSR